MANDDEADDSAFGPDKVRDLRSAPPPPKAPTEFHKAVTQIVLQYIGTAADNRHLAVLAKAQYLASRTVRRVIKQCELLNKQPIEFARDDIDAIVMEEDRADDGRNP